MRYTGVEKRFVIIVLICAAGFLTIGLALGIWRSHNLKDIVTEQFNEEQLVIAAHVSHLIERELAVIRREVILTAKSLGDNPFDPETAYPSMEKSLSRVVESGVWKIEVVDIQSQKIFTYLPYKYWSDRSADLSELQTVPVPEKRVPDTVWTSLPWVEPARISMLLGLDYNMLHPYRIIYYVNVSWFLTPFLKDIRSGKSGYAWLIDDTGRFLFHPQTDFIGENAFQIRQKKYPQAPYSIINFIQKEKMLKGQRGTGWYYSAWHRGFTGEIKKLIAYYPVMVSENPPQKWSVAVIAPIAEIENLVAHGHWQQLLMQSFVVLLVILGAVLVIYFERRWAVVLEDRVKERTEALTRSEEKYRSLVESAEDFIFTIDAEGLLLSVNSFAAFFFGGKPEDFIGKPLYRLFPEASLKNPMKSVAMVFRMGKSIREEFSFQMGKDHIWISANFMPLKAEQDRVIGVLCIARDITENKNLERQLVNAEKLASLGTLAAGVAHEVNNPLGVMLGFCDLLIRKSEEGSQMYEDLKTIERQGYHCKEIVENLLSFARVGKAGTELTEINACIETIIKVVKHNLDIHQIELDMHLGEDLPLVRGDFRQLQQVFLNLITNAVSAMPDGGRIGIETELERNGKKVAIRIQDNGTGIAEEDMDHIFEPFFTTKPEGEGTGLGLFVSYGIIKQYGGGIECKSPVETIDGMKRGALFTLRLNAESRRQNGRKNPDR